MSAVNSNNFAAQPDLLARFGELSFSSNPRLRQVQETLLALPPESERVTRREKLAAVSTSKVNKEFLTK